MNTSRCRGLAALLVAASLSASLAPTALTAQVSDESVARTLKLLKPPASPAEFWDAVKFSLNVGRTEDAANYLDRLLASDPPADLLITIRERDAAVYLPKLAANPKLQEKAVELLKRIEQAARDRARDPQRIQMFINYLVRSPQHRAYGISQLRSAGADAVPYLFGALRDPMYTEHRSTILLSMQKLDESAVPPMVAALASDDLALVSSVMQVLEVRGTSDTVPHLLYLAEATEIPETIRSQARATIEKILHMRYNDLPAAVVSLTAQARRCYDHQIDRRPSAAGTVRLWRWDSSEGLKSQEVTAGYADEYFGLEFCRQALRLEPNYEPAQILLLSLAMEKAGDRVGVDQPLPPGAGTASAAALAAGAPLLLKVLDAALNERHPIVAVGALRAITQTGDASSLADQLGSLSPVVKALAAPDRRIQFAAAETVVGIRPQQPMPGTTLVVPILARALSGDGDAKALVIDHDLVRGSELAALLRQAGYQTLHVANAREGFALAARSSSYELIFLEPNISNPDLSSTIVSLRNDPRTTASPILILANWDGAEPADPILDSLWRGEAGPSLELLREFGEQVAESKLDTTRKEAIQDQIVTSARVLQRYAENALLAPPHRVYLSTYLAELDRVSHEVKLVKAQDAERTSLLAALDQLAARVQRLARQMATDKTTPVRLTSYPGPQVLSKFERSYPRVKVLVRPNTLEMLQLQLEPYMASLQAKPLSAAERADYARRAAQGLARIARGEIAGIDVRPAEQAVLAALNNDSLGPDAMAVAARIPSDQAQRALADLALNGSANNALRLEAARQLTESLRSFGSRLPAELAAKLRQLFEQTAEPALHQALAAVVGALKPSPTEVGQRLDNLPTPPFEPGAAAKPEAEKPPAAKPEAEEPPAAQPEAEKPQAEKPEADKPQAEKPE